MAPDSDIRILRIKKRKDFLRATHNGRKYVMPGLLLQVVPNGVPNVMRSGFTTTKKLGCAVIRNRIRRRLREVARLVLPTQGVLGFDFVLIGRSAGLNRPFEKLKSDLSIALDNFKKSLKERNPIS